MLALQTGAPASSAAAKGYSLAEARAAPLFHVKVEVILVGIIGLWPENGAEFMTRASSCTCFTNLPLGFGVGSEATGGGDGGATSFAIAAVTTLAFSAVGLAVFTSGSRGDWAPAHVALKGPWASCRARRECARLRQARTRKRRAHWQARARSKADRRCHSGCGSYRRWRFAASPLGS